MRWLALVCFLCFGSALALAAEHAKKWNPIAGLANAGGASPAEKEGCFACEMTIRKAYDVLLTAGHLEGDRSLDLLAEEFKLALSNACANPPPVFYQGCGTILELREQIASDFIKLKTFDSMCKNTQLCWDGIYL